jgi:hypothetical protein
MSCLSFYLVCSGDRPVTGRLGRARKVAQAEPTHYGLLPCFIRRNPPLHHLALSQSISQLYSGQGGWKVDEADWVAYCRAAMASGDINATGQPGTPLE